MLGLLYWTILQCPSYPAQVSVDIGAISLYCVMVMGKRELAQFFHIVLRSDQGTFLQRGLCSFFEGILSPTWLVLSAMTRFKMTCYKIKDLRVIVCFYISMWQTLNLTKELEKYLVLIRTVFETANSWFKYKLKITFIKYLNGKH